MQVVEKEHTHKNREGNPSTVPQQQVPTFVQIPARTHTAHVAQDIPFFHHRAGL